ncbi:hypothetical protein KZZ52_14285 [Dactylosporangium sp. AC04546]|uniref:hypothetical protein n=1 Tax=Dactylosporangium sp. AC04546 TaxID=2862460 RepID=UPI001EDF55AC|nr:hypothetical protein [Dactylosporangium sp. AC04546]WVK86488.1 hypothetical protein KZZ52_14285 [Dactylosporangium sp. AC04546]
MSSRVALRVAPAGRRYPYDAGHWSTATFAGAELAAYAASDVHVVPPPLLLLMAAIVHVLAGAAATALWRRAAGALLFAVAVGQERPERPTRPVRAGFTDPPARASAWLMLRVSGRAPPAVTVPST